MIVPKIVIIIALIGGLFAARHYMHLKDDSIAEESIEELIYDYTDIDIDLTPQSPEK